MSEEAVFLIAALAASFVTMLVCGGLIDSRAARTYRAVAADQSLLSRSRWARLSVVLWRHLETFWTLLGWFPLAVGTWAWWVLFKPPPASVLFVMGFCILYVIMELAMWARHRGRTEC